MQINALEKTSLVSAHSALKGKNYTCPECRQTVRLRSGWRRSPHFYHLRKQSHCRQESKGVIHLALQLHLKRLLASEGSLMERPFLEVGRIADIACTKTHKIFEIQYSPISVPEAKKRCEDYASLGYQIIWILHEHTFNQRRITPAEHYLRSHPCYYTDFDETGRGIIYDQIEEIQGKRRLSAHSRRPINLEECHSMPNYWPFKHFALRTQSWPIYHTGDWIDLTLQGKKPPHTEQKTSLKTLLKSAYLTFLDQLLARSVR